MNMDNKRLKTALFGYSKVSVCEYIVQANEEFNKRLMEDAERYQKEKEAMQAKIDALETELAEYRRSDAVIAATLLDARQYAEELRSRAEEEERLMRKEHLQKCELLSARLASYMKTMEALRTNLTAFAENSNSELELYRNCAVRLDGELETDGKPDVLGTEVLTEETVVSPIETEVGAEVKDTDVCDAV